MSPTHGFLYGTSRAGKTTFAAHWAKPDSPLLVVTREPGPASAALGASGVVGISKLVVPKTPEELFVLLEYTDAYLKKHLAGFMPGMVLFDNLQGLQQLIIGEGARSEQEVAGVKVPAQPATGIMRLPVARADAATGQPAQMDYGILGRQTRRFLNLVDQLPFSTLITATEALAFDEKYRAETAGMNAQAAAGRPRKVMGYPSTEGKMILSSLPALVSGFFLRLTKKGDKYTIHTKVHSDSNGVEWFADPRGLPSTLSSEIDWTNKSAYDILLAGR